MAPLRLTDKHIKRMAAPTKGRLQLFDTDVKGLVFRVTAERKHDDGTASGAVRSFSGQSVRRQEVSLNIGPRRQRDGVVRCPRDAAEGEQRRPNAAIVLRTQFPC